MFIRRAITRRGADGEPYYSYRLVESRREGERVRQRTLLNLGRHFDVDAEAWPTLCARIEQLLGKQDSLHDVELTETLEATARSLVAQLVARAPQAAATPEFVEVDVHSLEQLEPRSVGVEHVALDALKHLELDTLLENLGVPAVTREMIFAQIVARMAAPGSERATWKWLNDSSALGELLGMSFANLSRMRLYRAADVLLGHREAIETHLFERVSNLFGLQATVTLYDLTNTYFEGEAASNPQAKRGKSKEKRSDCPLLTLGLVLDASGFVRRSRVFSGAAVEWRTLKEMLTGLGTPPGALVVMDRGIATQANIDWLRENGYRYLVVSREAKRIMPQGDCTVETAGQQQVGVTKVVDEEAGEARLYCHSSLREAKERGITQRACERLEAGLKKLAAGLETPRGEKRVQQIHERIAKLRQRCSRVARHYRISVETDEEATKVRSITWQCEPEPGSMLSDPGVYCLRTSETDWDEQRLWQTYMTLTDLEAVFRSLKSELGLRPIYHSKPERCEAHLFISVLAYQCVQYIRRHLKARGVNDSWTTLRATLRTQHRVTARFTQRDGRTLNVRKATQPDAGQRTLYEILGLDPLPGGTKKLVI